MSAAISDAAQAANQLAHLVNEAQSIVFFGGAGVSTASGIPDFRSVDGLYHQHFKYPPETMLSHSFYVGHTEEFFDFYRRKMVAPDAKPNQAHLKLAELEAQGKLLAVVTQNIDGLHQDAGSKRVLELHGSVRRNVCQGCGATYPVEWVMEREGVPRCERCGGEVKPDVVLYEEALDDDVVSAALGAIAACDLLIVGGTSLVVYPAAGLIEYRPRDAKLVVVNRDATPADAKADLVIQCDIAKAFEF